MCPLSKEALAKNSKMTDYYEFREGVNMIRILPADVKWFDEDVGYFDLSYISHWGLGAEGSPPIVCPRTHDETARCPICEKTRALKKNPAYADLVKSIRAQTRYLYNILDIEHPEKGIQVMETGWTVHKGIRGVALDADYGDILDPDVGRTFKITLVPGRKNKTGYNQYEVLASANASSVMGILPEGWKVALADLVNQIGESKPYEELKEILEGSVPESEKTDATPPKAATVTKTEETKKEETKSEPEKKEDPAPKAEASGKPGCFGKEFVPSEERCKPESCSSRKECVQEYIRTV